MPPPGCSGPLWVQKRGQVSPAWPPDHTARQSRILSAALVTPSLIVCIHVCACLYAYIRVPNCTYTCVCLVVCIHVCA